VFPNVDFRRLKERATKGVEEGVAPPLEPAQPPEISIPSGWNGLCGPTQAHQPGVLWNSSKNPLYMFCFAVGNERGKDIALRIANPLLKPLKEVR